MLYRWTPCRWERSAAAAAATLVLLGSCSKASLGARTGGPTLSFAPPDHAPDAAVPESRSTPDAAAAGAESGRSARSGELPDPTPLASSEHWRYELHHRDGSVSVTRVTLVRHARAVVTPRHLGRFAIELWIGRELIDRVRFDFPLLADDSALREGQGSRAWSAPSFGPGADVTCAVLVPASPRATRAELVDRSTGSRTSLPWPPAPADPRAPPAASEEASGGQSR